MLGFIEKWHDMSLFYNQHDHCTTFKCYQSSCVVFLIYFMPTVFRQNAYDRRTPASLSSFVQSEAVVYLENGLT